MSNEDARYKDVDAVVIGGGFYGCAIAIFLAKQRGFKVLLVEREGGLMKRASYNNQARVHNGYHYPRSFVTAYRSRINLPRFINDWPDAVCTDFTKLYAIARRNSKVTARQFRKFCTEIGAYLEVPEVVHRQLFNPKLIEDVFLVQEYAFDSTKLADWASIELKECGVSVDLSSRIDLISHTHEKGLSVRVKNAEGVSMNVGSKYVLNCTYSGLNQFLGGFPGTDTKLKHEITEMALIRMPETLCKVGVTVMDGPFFSAMPFPARQLHTLSHVRYTPHVHWFDRCGIDPYEKLDKYEKESRYDRMMRDVERYIPSISEAKYVDSLFEVKSILVKNESDDGRPILFERHDSIPGCYSILGGKIDNIYDALERIDNEIN